MSMVRKLNSVLVFWAMISTFSSLIIISTYYAIVVKHDFKVLTVDSISEPSVENIIE